MFDFLLRPLTNVLASINLQLEAIMSKLSEILDRVVMINDATVEVVSDLKKLRESLVGGVTAEGADEIISKLDEAVAKLVAAGVDPIEE